MITGAGCTSNHAAETFEILTNKTLKSYTTRTFKTAAAETLRTHAAEPLKTHTTGNHAAETPGTNNTKNNPLDNGKMIENAAYFYAKNNTGNNTKKYVFNYTLETVRSAYKITHITNATVLPQKRKNGLNRANNASQDHFNYLTYTISITLSKTNLATPKKDAADASSKVPAHQKRRNSSGRR